MDKATGKWMLDRLSTRVCDPAQEKEDKDMKKEGKEKTENEITISHSPVL